MFFILNSKLVASISVSLSNGLFREARESWSDPLDPCNVCTCRLVHYVTGNAHSNIHSQSPHSTNENHINSVTEGGGFNNVKVGKNEVFCMRMTLVECYMRISGNKLFYLFVCLFVQWNATCEYQVPNCLFCLFVRWNASWEHQINSCVCLFVCLSV